MRACRAFHRISFRDAGKSGSYITLAFSCVAADGTEPVVLVYITSVCT
uniref:Uncharacterized protein n=1 Tax=Anguilla anguilla TaxID=7936 RepID=A0A0E9S063_ANGAN